MKPGHKTTEFWVTLGSQILGMLALFGVFTPEQSSALSQAVPQIGGLITVVLGAFGYSLSRGSAKRNGG
jgi:hypothetical protein